MTPELEQLHLGIGLVRKQYPKTETEIPEVRMSAVELIKKQSQLFNTYLFREYSCLSCKYAFFNSSIALP
jgi:hypothetical protein